jgi:hypothetical protein
MSVTHPKIVAMKQELENHRKHINCAPKGSMELTLPVPVKTDPDTVSFKLAKGSVGELILMADLCCFHRKYTEIKPVFKCVGPEGF